MNHTFNGTNPFPGTFLRLQPGALFKRPTKTSQTRMRLFIFFLGTALLLGAPLLLSQLGSPPATKPKRMREAEIDMIEFERIQRERELEEEGSEPFAEDL